MNPRQVLDRLDEDEKGVISMDTLGGEQKVNIINQYGLFSLILSSRKPSAKAFKRWVTHEVLPSIAAKGSYSIPNPEPEPKSLPGTSLERWAELIAALPGLANSPIVMSALQCRVAEELSGCRAANPVDTPILLTVRANQLGCPHFTIGDGSMLGKYIIACGFEPIGKEQHGRYKVNVYRPSPELDAAIVDFCTVP